MMSVSPSSSRTTVLKFGGSSVADALKIRRVASMVAERCRRGEHLVIVVSAMGKSTNALIDLAESVVSRSCRCEREMDMLLATGEQVSASLMAMALCAEGLDAISMNAFQIGMHTTAAHTRARICDIDLSRLKDELGRRGVVVVTGFQGIDVRGDLTTLGRGGSDTSAIALAAVLGCPCEIYSDVPGVFTCDPRVISGARKLDCLTYREMLELAASGAKVLHPRGVEIAARRRVPLYCGATFSDEHGTHIVEFLPENTESPVVTGLAVDTRQHRVTLRGLPEDIRLFRRIFGCLASRGISVDMVATMYEGCSSTVTFSVMDNDAQAVIPALSEIAEAYPALSMDSDGDVAKLSIIGTRLYSEGRVAPEFFATLSKFGICVIGAVTSELKISVLVPRFQVLPAAKALAEKYNLSEKQKEGV